MKLQILTVISTALLLGQSASACRGWGSISFADENNKLIATVDKFDGEITQSAKNVEVTAVYKVLGETSVASLADVCASYVKNAVGGPSDRCEEIKVDEVKDATLLIQYAETKDSNRVLKYKLVNNITLTKRTPGMAVAASAPVFSAIPDEAPVAVKNCGEIK